ncbi:DUF805 domain-containing protein [Pseudomonas entomophila]|nr:DUF805 domain-containing protein [Pseudomonas entomophila]MDF0734188.1 DUF805 domain-containing protein [Pseudomonas entomophila]
MVFCRGCAKEIHQSALSCPACGAQQVVTASPGVAMSAQVTSGNVFIEVLKKYAVFQGRARRKEYWMFTLYCVLISFVLGFFEGMFGITQVFSGLFRLLVLVPSIAVAVRRLHDGDHSGWWLLVPIVNLVFLIQNGTPGNNRFGPNPKGNA